MAVPRRRIGVPVPGVELKVAPVGGALEARVRGPNITPGYWRDPELTRAAFDERGLSTVWATRSASSIRPTRRVDSRFEGRLAEDFKLSTGTWVRVGPLRARLLAHFGDLAQDVVIAGHDRDHVAVLLFPNVAACRAIAGAAADEPVRAVLARVRGVRAISFECSPRSRRRSPAVRRGSSAPYCSTSRRRSTRRRSPTRGRSISRPCFGIAARWSSSSTARRVLACTIDISEGRFASMTIRPDELTAIDVHVHLEPPPTGAAADVAARKYFGESGAQPRPARPRRVLPVAQDGVRRVLGRRTVVGTAAAVRTTTSLSSPPPTPTSRSRLRASTRIAAPTAFVKRGGWSRRAAFAA